MPELSALKDAFRDVEGALTELDGTADEAIVMHFKVQSAISQTMTHLQNALTTIERALKVVRGRRGMS